MDDSVRVLMVTPYPPVRDGIAAYALQEVGALRGEGCEVDVLSPFPSAAQHHLDLRGPRGAFALARRVRRYDKVVVQFHPDIFYPLPKIDRSWAVENVALQVAFRLAPHVEVRVHEIDYRDGRQPGALGVTSRSLWRAVDRIVVHTERERADFIEAFGVEESRVTLSAHGANFRRHTASDRKEARRSFGLAEDTTVFLAIGFVQPHKGFDRAVRAFAGLAEHDCRLDIVGSPRLTDPTVAAYVEELRTLASNTPGVHLHLDFVSDEMFDRWLLASDVVVLPYRWVWSSGVLERAALYDRPIIATSVGGLAEQALGCSDVTLVADDAELARAMWAAGGDDAAAELTTSSWPTDAADPRSAVQAAVVDRATRRRGHPLVPASDAEDGPSTTPAATSALWSLGGVGIPDPWSDHRPVRGLPRWLVRRLTGWELEPLVAYVNALQAATASAVDAVSRASAVRTPRPQDDQPTDDGPRESLGRPSAGRAARSKK
jgi:glycosyltransferase involved in cell wall biosynthesis